MIDRRLYTPNGTNPDFPVPFGPSQTVPTEQMVNLLADALQTIGTVLEIGTGSGYQTAVLAERCAEVVSIEVQPSQILGPLPENVTIISADGCTHDTGEEFDAVLVTFAVPEIMPVWIKQLREGGRIVVPIQDGPCCLITTHQKRGGELAEFNVIAYAQFTERV